MSFRRFGSRVRNFTERRTDRQSSGRRKSDRQRQLKRQISRQSLVQQLEDRRLLAGPELIAIRPDAGALLNDGDTLNTAPREFNLLFKGGADLNESSITGDSIRLVRSGGDGTFDDGNEVDVSLGYIGLVNPGSVDAADLQQVVFRTSSQAAHNANDPSQAFPDDTYQIQIWGSGDNPLTNNSGEAFNDGENLLTEFRLDLGAQVVSVVPQPISHDPLSQANNEIVVYFDDQPLDPAQATDPAYYRLINTGASLTESDDTTTLPETVTYDAATNQAVLTFASDIPEGTYRLDIGQSGGDNATLGTAVQLGSLTDSNPFNGNAFLGDSGGVSNDAGDLDLYEMSLESGATLTVELTPDAANLNLRARVLDSTGNELADGTMGAGNVTTLNLPIAVAGVYFVEVSSADGSTGSYEFDATVAGSPVSINDDNSTFSTATRVGTLGASTMRISSAITPQGIPLPPRPGSDDEPGNRQIQREQHTGLTGTSPTLPSEITVINYYFPDTLGVDPSGEPYINLITETEKQLVREIFEIYAELSGYEFIESSVTVPFGDDLMIGKGDFRAVDPTLGPNAGVAGLANPFFAILNGALFNQSNRFYGDGFTETMFHEIGHSLGLGHSYEIPSNQGLGVPNDVLPGDHDVVHLQRISPPNSTDIDMYEFTVSESGRLSVETIAERLPVPSLLDTSLSLYRRTGSDFELVARNDQYFGADSLIDIELTPGDYFIGVSSAGNTNYDPRVPDSGFGGTTDGVYDLQLSFEADRDGQLTDADGTPIDGDADGTPGGVHSFWFQASDQATTIYVSKTTDTTIGPEGSGTLADPYDTIDFALEKAGNRIVVPVDGANTIADGESFIIDDGVNATTFRFGTIGFNPIDLSATTTPSDVTAAIVTAVNLAKANGDLLATVDVAVVGRTVEISGINNLDIDGSPTLMSTPNLVQILADGGEDMNIDTLADNRPYLVGFDTLNNPLADGAEFLVPQGVTAMIEAGALFKMRQSNLDAGTSGSGISRSGAAIQVLGTPERSVFLRSLHNDSVGGDSDGVGPDAVAGNFGGIVFRDDSDMESSGVFLNYVNHADINNGGGRVFVDATELFFTPIFIEDARPTVSFNLISNSDGAAVSASPNSFDDSLGRIGPEVTGNFLVENSIDALFIRVVTPLGGTIDKLESNGRFDDTDITHTFAENLLIAGGAGGPVLTPAGDLVARSAGRLQIDPGVVIKLNDSRIEVERGAGTLIAEGTLNRPIVFTSTADDRFGGSGSFNTDRAGANAPAPSDWGGLYFGHATSGSIDNAYIAFGGGVTAIEGGSARFNAIEVHQADVRIANSLLQSNAGGGDGSQRGGRGLNTNAAIYIRGSQTAVINNEIVDNLGAAISINANSLNYETVFDSGRMTGPVDDFEQISGNQGALIRLNQLENNAINGLVVRGEELTTESVWDDTDIVHVVNGEVIVDNHHSYSGLKLLSSNSESLVIKFATPDSGFTATGTPLEIIDRIGGSIHVLGTPGKPVVMTSLSDDSTGAGFTPSGEISFNTNNSASPSTGAAGDWRGLLFDEFSNDRNVAIIREAENPVTNANDVNSVPSRAQDVGTLAPNQKSGDENRRLGFEISGFISPTDPDDMDVYSFTGTAGTEIWLDIDRTSSSLDAIVEVVNASGTVLARSVRSGSPDPGNLNASPLTQNPLLGGDHYTQNFRDPGLRYILPGTPGQTGTFFVRVRSNPESAGDVRVLAGESRGQYQLQIRLDQIQEFPGSTVRYSDIRYASTGIDVRGLPARSPLIGEAGELTGESFGGAQQLVNLLETDMAAIGIGGDLAATGDVDWYEFELTQTGVQLISGVNDGAGTIAVVFDIDYADQAVRADTTIAVYDQDQNLVFVGRESDVTDDRQSSPDGSIEDLSRGSLGQKDPYIGPIHLTPGTETSPRRFYVAVMSDRQLPSALTGVFQANPTNAGNQLVRLEPVNSVVRIVEDHIGYNGYVSREALVLPEQPAGLFDISTMASVDINVDPFSLQDVVLYVATDQPEDNNNFGDDDVLYTAEPYRSSRWLTRVTEGSGGNLVDGVNDIQDVTMRTDGRMFGYQRLNGDEGNVGSLVEISPEDGSVTAVAGDNINGRTPTPNTSSYPQQVQDDFSRTTRADQFTTSDDVDALTHIRTGTTGPGSAPVPTYEWFYVVPESDTSSKLYRASEDGDASLRINRTPVPGGNLTTNFGFIGDIQPAGVTHSTQILTVQGNPPNNGPTPTTNIRLRSKVAGSAGDFNIQIVRPNNTAADVAFVDFNSRTIFLRIGGTGNPINAGPSAQAIVDVINNDPDASQLVTAVIFNGNSNARGDGAPGTAATSFIGITSINPGQDGVNGPLRGKVTGVAHASFFSDTSLFGVTDAGEFIEINQFTGEVINVVDAAATIGVAGLSFEGLALGPQNVEGGAYRDTLFAITDTGELVAFDTSGNGVLAFDPDGSGGAPDSPILDISGINGSGSLAVGLAFSPLDFNLWHPTTQRGTDAGHGINEAPDDTRAPADIARTVNSPGSTRRFDEIDGGVSYQFGFEQWQQNQNNTSEQYLIYQPGVNAQYGILTTEFHADLSSNPAIVDTTRPGPAGTYNLPGGALGTLTTNPFDLTETNSSDRPTLYFNYFLDTENYDGSDVDDDDDDPFRDSARVFISADGGNSWDLVATNNSQLSSPNPNNGAQTAELPGFLSHLSDAGLNSARPRPQSQQIVQELFDNSGQWRQARIDLSPYAGLPGLQMRIDFSTAGAMNDDSLVRIDGEYDPNAPTDASPFGEFVSRNNANARSVRSTNNQFEGFYIDDIIIGYAERGEMVTGTNGDATITNLFAAGARTRDLDGEQFPDITTGPYQLEIRRTDEHILLGQDGPVVARIFDTNDRHVDTATETALVTFEPATFVPDLTATTTASLPGVNLADIVAWSPTTTRPATGTQSLESGAVGADQVAVFEATLAELGTPVTESGVIRFTYSVSSTFEEYGLRFFIDGVPQSLASSLGETPPADPTLASGELNARTVEFSFGSGNPTFTWVYDGRALSGTSAPIEGLHRAFLDDVQVLQGGTGLLADRNRERPQGTLILNANTITDSAGFGINVEPGTTQAGGSVPHPGSNINFPQLNAQRLIPGIVIQNNVVAGSSGIRFAGETNPNPSRPVPLGRLINNTLVGENQSGVGIRIDGLASPTLMNNLISDYATGIVNGGVGTVIRSNFFQGNNNNGAVGASPIIGGATDPLFVDAANRNFYLEATSLAVDSGQTTEQDRQDYVTFKTELGIPASPINAPDRDLFGQLRVEANSSPIGDRGAVERQDDDAPYATILNPIDNDAQGLDLDPSPTVIIVSDPLLENFTILLGDGRGPNSPFEGTGVDGLTVDDPTDNAVSMQAVTISQNGTPLVEGVDYNLAYNELSGVLRLTPLSTLWEQSSVYIISLNNTLIADKAGNRLRSNQPNGDTQFTVIIPDVGIDFGDAPDSYRTTLARDGARHAIAESMLPILGTAVDADDDGVPSADADGDDLDMDDEDGLPIGTFDGTTPVDGLFLGDPSLTSTSDPNDVVAYLNPNDPAGSVLPVTVTGEGLLDAWIDFNRDGDFLDVGEYVISGQAVVDGVNPIRVFTPAGASVGETIARFRISEEGSPTPFGIAIGGEVEDHQVLIADVAQPILVGDAYSVDEDEALTVDGVANPSVFDNDTLPDEEFVAPRMIIGEPLVAGTTDTYETTNGTVRIDDASTGHFTYIPNVDYFGPDSFRYRISTQRNEGPEAEAVAVYETVSLTVVPVNDRPGVVDQDLVATEFQPGQSPADMAQVFPASIFLAGATGSENADPDLSTPPFDESDQIASLRLVALEVNGVTIDESNQSAVGTTSLGGTVTAEFVTELADPNDPTTSDRVVISNVFYQGAEYFNSDNPLTAMGDRLLDEFVFTVQDDGRLDDGNGGIVVGDPLSADGVANVLVTPQNSTPVARTELVSASNPDFIDFYNGQSLVAPVPTEDESLTIPSAFLLTNDSTGPDAAGDEILGTNGNDGSVRVVSVSVDPAFGTMQLDAASGDILFVPVGDVYGQVEFTYEIEDEGVDEAIDGTRTDAPLRTTVTSTIFLEPVNDVPVAYDRSLSMVEAVEPAGPAILSFDADDLIVGGGVISGSPITTSGNTITLVDGSQLVDGQTLLITDSLGNRTVVEFSTDTNASVGTDILVTYDQDDLATEITADLASQLIAAGLGGVVSGAADEIITLPVVSSVTTTTYSAATMASASGLSVPDGSMIVGGEVMTFTDNLGQTLSIELSTSGVSMTGADLLLTFATTDTAADIAASIKSALSAQGIRSVDDPAPPAGFEGLLFTDPSVTAINDAASLITEAGGVITLPADGAGLIDGETVTLADGLGNSLTVEFNTTGTPAMGSDVVVQYAATETAAEIAANLTAALLANDLSAVDGMDGTVALRSITSGAVTPPMTSFVVSPDLIMMPDADQIIDGETLTLTIDGVPVVVEFNSSGVASTGTDYVVTLVSGDTADTLATTVETALRADGFAATAEGGNVRFGNAQTLVVSELPAVPGLFDPSLGVPYNEIEQMLRVVSFTTAEGTVLIPAGETGSQTLATDAGGTLTFDYTNGIFVSGTYQPADDYNQRPPFAAADLFTYTISDDGMTTLPGSGGVVTLPEEESLEQATVTITVQAANDRPFIEFDPDVDILEDPTVAESTIPDVFTQVLPGPPSAEDEQIDQGRPTVTDIRVTDPMGIMTQLPVVTIDGGLTVFPATDAVGQVIYGFTFTDDDPLDPQSTDVTVTVNVRPVNDAPRFDPDVAGEQDVLNDDDAYSVDRVVDPDTGQITDARITYTLREDNTQPVGDPDVLYFIPLRRDDSVTGYNPVGLLDVFIVGPDNEMFGSPVDGGDQTVSLDSVPARTNLGGTLTLGMDSTGTPGVYYDPPADVNNLNAPVDSFTYTVIDDGTTWNAGMLESDPQTATNIVQFVLTPVNDRPEFQINLPPADPNDPTGPRQAIEVSEDSDLTSINGFAFNVAAGPRTSAFDEVDIINGQAIDFEIDPLDFDVSQAGDFFTQYPTIDNNGELTFQAAPDVFGQFSFEVTLVDDGPQDASRGDLFVSEPQTIAIDVLPINDPPVVRTDVDPLEFATDEDQSFVIPLRAADGVSGLLDVFAVGPANEAMDIVPGGNQTLTLVQPTPGQSTFQGSIVENFEGGELVSLTYTPAENFVGTDTFSYQVSDNGITVDLGSGGTERPDARSASNIVSIIVDPVNDPPQFGGPVNVTVNEDDGAVQSGNWAVNVAAGPPSATDELANQDLFFTITQVSGDTDLFTSEPVAVIDDASRSATLEFTTAPDANGVAIYDVQLFDVPSDGTPQLSSSVRRFTLTVAPVNDPPTFVNDGQPVVVDEDSGPYGEPWATEISPGPADESGQSVRFEVITPVDAQPLFQQLPTIGDDGVLRFLPAVNANGTIDLTVTAIDVGGATSDPVTLRLVIDPVNDQPTAVADSIDSDEDTVLTIAASTLLANDVDPDIDNPDDSLSVVLPAEFFSLSGARVTYNSTTGQIVYDPTTSITLQSLAGGESGVDSFTYRAVDSQGVESNIVTVAINLDGINDAPVALPDAPTLNPDGPTIIEILANDSDVDGTLDPQSVQITLQPAFGSIVVDDQGVVTFTSDPSFGIEDVFRYRVADNNGVFSAETLVRIEANAAPIARDDQAGTFLGEVINIDVSANDEDPDRAAGAANRGLDLTSIEVVGGPFSGDVVALGDGTIRYIPADGFLGTDTFQYTIADLDGRVSSPGTVQVRVSGSRLQNPDLNADVNDDGRISPIDALLVINRLSRSGTGSIPVGVSDVGPPYYDVNGDQRITPIDALEVINELARNQSSGQGEGEQVVSDFLTSSSTTIADSTPATSLSDLSSGPKFESDDNGSTFVFDDGSDDYLNSIVSSADDDDEEWLAALDSAFEDLL